MITTTNDKQLTLPDFIIIGASRSGTSKLYYHLRDHPEIFMPEVKEPHFFNFPESWTIDEYAELFQTGADNQLLGEATATYLYYYEESIKNIKIIYGPKYKKLKLIAILRNPVERAWSHYTLMRRKGHNKGFFETIQQNRQIKNHIVYNDFISPGMYHKQIEAYYNDFPYVKVFLFDEFINNTDHVLKQIFDFLGLADIDFLPKNLKGVFNRSGLPKNKILWPLHYFLFQDNSRLKTFLKPFIPFNIRQNLQTKIANWIFKKQNIPREVNEYLSNTFEQDLKSFINLFEDDKKRQIVQNWINSPKNTRAE